MNKKNVALVLSSGGSRGLAHIGAIKALEERGFMITSVAGSSIGSVIGGLYAMNQLNTYVDWVSTLNMKSVWGLLDFTFNKNGIIKGDRVFDKMKAIIPDENIENMKIPFAAVATDLLNERDVVFKTGSFYEAVRASISIPAMLTPVKYEDTWLVDGGVLNPMPMDHVKRLKGDLLVVVSLHGQSSGQVIKTREEEERSYFTRMFKALSMQQKTPTQDNIGYYDLLNFTSSAMINKIVKLSLDIHQPNIVIDIPNDASGIFEFYKAKELIALGEKIAHEQIDNYLTKN
jgi:NTE family protein